MPPDLSAPPSEGIMVWNTNAGSTSADPGPIQSALEAVGIHVAVIPTASLEELDAVLEAHDPDRLLVVAGGDGSLRQVVKRLPKLDVPMLHLPLGTANNFAGALEIRLEPFELIRRLERRCERRVDLGRLRFQGNEDVFLEGAGIGLFAHAMLTYGEDQGKSVLRALNALTQTIVSNPNHEIEARFLLEDGSVEEFRGAVALLEVLNTPAIGPRMPLASSADPTDGVLELVTIEPSAGVGFLQYAINTLNGSLETLENVTVRRVRQVSVEFAGGALHFDGESSQLEPVRLEFCVEPGALRLVVPEPIPEPVPASLAAVTA